MGFDLEADPALFELAVRALAEGNSIHSTARIVQVDKDTICEWLNRAAHQCRLVMLYHWRDLPGTHPRQPVAPQMEASHPGYGSWHDGSRLDHSGTAGVSGTSPISG